jgi:cytochrome c
MSVKYLVAIAAVLALASAAQAQDVSADGQKLFQQRCASCHGVEAGQNRIGPSLLGVFGRTAGTLEGARFSPALQNSGIVWNEETLSSYLDNPRGLVPQTTMTVALRDPAQRDAIIAYLRTLAPQSPQ